MSKLGSKVKFYSMSPIAIIIASIVVISSISIGFWRRRVRLITKEKALTDLISIRKEVDKRLESAIDLLNSYTKEPK